MRNEEAPESLPETTEQAVKLLGFAARSRRIVCGAGQVIAQITSRTPPTVAVIASDASERTLKQLTDKCRSHGVRAVRTKLTGAELADLLGKGGATMAAAPTDQSIASEIVRLTFGDK